jgi:hypothetical protein
MKILKTFLFNPKILTLDPEPHCLCYNSSVFQVDSVGVSLKGYRQNWQERKPGEEKTNQLINTNSNK